MRLTTTLQTLVLMFTSAMAIGETDDQKTDGEFFEEREQGWHWYKDPPPPDEEEKVPEPAIQMSSPSTASNAPAPLSASWLREMLPVLRDAAIDSPTDDNVRAYFYAQRIMMDKAQVFSDKAQQVVTNDPLLDENNRLPFASAAKVSFLHSAEVAKKELVSGLAGNVGFWVFYDESCTYCKEQIGPINQLVQRHAVTVEVIHKNGERIEGLDPRIKVRRANGQFETLGINFTPAVMMVAPPDGYYVISQGFTAYTTLVDRIIAAANQYGFINEKQYMAAVPTTKGVLHADSLEAQEQINWDNSEEWVPFIRQQLAETYGIDMSTEVQDEIAK